ncbi:Flp family type IVb pilin [Zobellella sp. DQSA1]|uniref:Flp family type IVb pilin n=1 Tax=Zobellella sp. DQSA1 TaxID=3342386 RepID=UPI0035C1487A
MLVEQIRLLLQDEQGITKVEYAVAGTLLAIAVILAFGQLGGAVARVIFYLARLLGGDTEEEP